MPETSGTKGLSATAVKNAKPRDKAFKLSDRDGLYLLVKPSGVRYWRMNYRFGGQQRTLSFGRWPEVMLGEARDMLLEARRLLAKGIDPLEQARLEKIEKSLAAANTIQCIADEWIAKIETEGAAPMTVKKARWLLGKIYPSIGKRPITEISAPELLLALKKVEATKRYDTANRIRTACSQVFRYAIVSARAGRDVAADLRGALITPKAKHRAAVQPAFATFGPKGAEAHRHPATSHGRAITDRDEDDIALIALHVLEVLDEERLGIMGLEEGLDFRRQRPAQHFELIEDARRCAAEKAATPSESSGWSRA